MGKNLTDEDSKKGGQARAESLTPKQRSEIASKAGTARADKLSKQRRSQIASMAAEARWKKHREAQD